MDMSDTLSGELSGPYGSFAGPSSTEQQIEEVRQGLKALAVGFEAYRIDHGVYPDTMEQLLAPVAYLKGYVEDPFRGAGWTDPRSRSLRMAYSPGYKEILLYSIGPDGVDQSGRFPYNPANGLVSEGDIVHALKLDTFRRFEDREIADRVKRQEVQFAAARSAIEAFREHGETISLLLTDVVLPDHSGPQLADRLQTERPELGVIYMSGYTDDDILRHGIMTDAAHYIEKPIVFSKLLNKIRSILDDEPTASIDR